MSFRCYVYIVLFDYSNPVYMSDEIGSSVFLCLHSLVIGMINSCVQRLVSELPLLIPLLHTLRHSGADAGRLGPTIEEMNWAGLENVEFNNFRERIRSFSDKRRFVQLSLKVSQNPI